MRKSNPTKFLYWLLLVVMVTVTIDGVHNNAHAMQGCVIAASNQASSSEISASRQYPDSPPEHHNDFDGCDTCSNCDCHEPLTIQRFQLSYNPIILNPNTSSTFKHLPEVYLSKFIPPQNPA
jgi:hypothetical protein